MNTFRRRSTANLNASSNNESDENNDNEVQEPEQQNEDFYWNTVPERIHQKDLEETYNQVVYWRKNIFMVPTGAARKKVIDGISRLLNLWTNGTPLKNIALTAIHVMLAPLLQKPSKNSKAKEHPKAQQPHHEVILQDPKKQIHNTVYEDIDEYSVKKTAVKTKGGCGPSGLDADNCHNQLNQSIWLQSLRPSNIHSKFRTTFMQYKHTPSKFRYS